MTVPIGTILAYGGLVDGNAKGQLQSQGWLVCDGEEYSEDEYPELDNTIGVYYGTPSRPGMFKVPDLRGRFVRGVDAGAGRDPDVESRSGGHQQTKLGSVQEDEMQAHKHEDSGHTHQTATHRYAGGLNTNTPKNGAELTNWERMQPVSDRRRRGRANLGEPARSSAGNVRYGQETRPKNIYVNWIIKARDV